MPLYRLSAKKIQVSVNTFRVGVPNQFTICLIESLVTVLSFSERPWFSLFN